MSEPIEFFVAGTPAPKGSFRIVTRGRGGKALPFPRVLKDTPKTEAWHAMVAHEAEQRMRGRVPFAGVALAVSIRFYLRRPEGHFSRNGLKPSAPLWPAVKPDIDKLLRATLDPLEGLVFDGDSRIVVVDAIKHYAPLGRTSGAQIIVREQP